MLDTIFNGIFDGAAVAVISVPKFLLCMAVSLFVGLLLAAVHTYKNRYTKSFLVTLAMLPAIVCVIIMMVNGNVGAGVAVAGAFSLVRFRAGYGKGDRRYFSRHEYGAGCGNGLSGICGAFCRIDKRRHAAL